MINNISGQLQYTYTNETILHAICLLMTNNIFNIYHDSLVSYYDILITALTLYKCIIYTHT